MGKNTNKFEEYLRTGNCLVIGEVAQAHDGSLGTAHAFIDAIAKAGADAVKFQTHIAAAESTPQEPWRVKFSPQDETRYDYWQRMEFTEKQWAGLKKHAEDKGLLFISSPFSVEAAQLLARIGIEAWKIASGEVNSAELFDCISDTKLPVLLSTGMSSIEEIDASVKKIKHKKLPLAVMQCTSMYPCPPEKVGLNMISFFRDRYKCFVGLSDHSATIYPGLAAATLGINLLEVHVTLSREMFGPDVSSSVTSTELARLVEGVRCIEKITANPVDKDAVAASLAPMRQLFTKSVVARTALKKGTVLAMKHLQGKKPGTGIPIDRIADVIGKRLKNDLPADHLLSENDLET